MTFRRENIHPRNVFVGAVCPWDAKIIIIKKHKERRGFRIRFEIQAKMKPLQWSRNEHDGVSHHLILDCLVKKLFRRRLKKASKLRDTDLCEEIHRWLTLGIPLTKGRQRGKCFHLMTSSFHIGCVKTWTVGTIWMMRISGYCKLFGQKIL